MNLTRPLIAFCALTLSFIVVACLLSLSSATASSSPPNQPPVAEDDTLLVHGVTSLAPLLQNDSDPAAIPYLWVAFLHRRRIRTRTDGSLTSARANESCVYDEAMCCWI
jgi:hypothetical protein